VVSSYGYVSVSFVIEQIALMSLSLTGTMGLCNGVCVLDHVTHTYADNCSAASMKVHEEVEVGWMVSFCVNSVLSNSPRLWLFVYVLLAHVTPLDHCVPQPPYNIGPASSAGSAPRANLLAILSCPFLI
jgi:hypothetical protein